MSETMKKVYDNIISNKNLFYYFDIDGKIVSDNDFHNMNFNEAHVYPGSFNPIHNGHKNIFDSIKKNSNNSMCFYEISLSRIDKNFLSFEDFVKTELQFKWYAPVVFTNAPKFKDKINAFNNKINGLNFHVGIDTAERIIQHHPFDEIENYNALFHVYERIVENNHKKINNLEKIPKNFIEGILLDKNHIDISSSSIRNKV